MCFLLLNHHNKIHNKKENFTNYLKKERQHSFFFIFLEHNKKYLLLWVLFSFYLSLFSFIYLFMKLFSIIAFIKKLTFRIILRYQEVINHGIPFNMINIALKNCQRDTNDLNR